MSRYGNYKITCNDVKLPRKVRSRKKAIFELNVIIERIISIVTVEFPTKPEDTHRVLQRMNEIASERVQYGRIDYDKSTVRHRELNRRDRKIAEDRRNSSK